MHEGEVGPTFRGFRSLWTIENDRRSTLGFKGDNNLNFLRDGKFS